MRNIGLRQVRKIRVAVNVSSHHVVLDVTSVIVHQRAGGLVEVDDVGVGEEINARGSASEAHDCSIPDEWVQLNNRYQGSGVSFQIFELLSYVTGIWQEKCLLIIPRPRATVHTVSNGKIHKTHMFSLQLLLAANTPLHPSLCPSSFEHI